MASKLQNKNGKRMGFATLDDRTGRLEVAVFSEAFDQFREYLDLIGPYSAFDPETVDAEIGTVLRKARDE